MKFFIVCIVLFALVFGSLSTPYFRPCRRNDRNLDRCIINLVKLMKGRLHSLPLPPLELIFVPHIFSDTTLGSDPVQVTFNDVQIDGGSNFDIEFINVASSFIDFKIIFKEINVKSTYLAYVWDYAMDRHRENGTFQGNFYEMEVVGRMYVSPVSRRRTWYLKLDYLKTVVSIGAPSLKVQPNQLSPIGEALKEACANPVVFLKEKMEMVNENTALVFKIYLEKLFDRLPLSYVLTDYDQWLQSY